MSAVSYVYVMMSEELSNQEPRFPGIFWVKFEALVLIKKHTKRLMTWYTLYINSDSARVSYKNRIFS